MTIETQAVSNHPDAPIDRWGLRDHVATTLQELSERQEDIQAGMQSLMDEIVASRGAIGQFCAEVGEGSRRIVILKHDDHDETNMFTHFFLSVNGPMAVEVKFPARPSKEGLAGMIRMGKLDKVHRQYLVPLIDNLCERDQGSQAERNSAGLTVDGYSYNLSLPPLPGKLKGRGLVITSDHGQNPRIVPVTIEQFKQAFFNSMDEFPMK